MNLNFSGRKSIIIHFRIFGVSLEREQYSPLQRVPPRTKYPGDAAATWFQAMSEE